MSSSAAFNRANTNADIYSMSKEQLLEMVEKYSSENMYWANERARERRGGQCATASQEPDPRYDIQWDRIRDLRIACSLILQVKQIFDSSQTKSENLNFAIQRLKEAFMWTSTEINEQEGK